MSKLKLNEKKKAPIVKLQILQYYFSLDDTMGMIGFSRNVRQCKSSSPCWWSDAQLLNDGCKCMFPSGTGVKYAYFLAHR